MSFWSSGSGSSPGFLDGHDDDDEFSDTEDHFAEFERGYAAEQHRVLAGQATTYGEVPTTTSEPGTPASGPSLALEPSARVALSENKFSAEEPSWLNSFNAPRHHAGVDDDNLNDDDIGGAAPSHRCLPRRRRSSSRRQSTHSRSSAPDAAAGCAVRTAVRRRSSVTFMFDDAEEGPCATGTISQPRPVDCHNDDDAGTPSSSRRSSLSSLGGIDALEGWDPSAADGSDDDDHGDTSHDGLFSRVRVVHDGAAWRDDGLVFAVLPPCPPDADATYFLDADFVEAAVDADEARRANFAPASMRRYFDEPARASRMERARVAERSEVAEAALAASPLGSSTNASQLFPSRSLRHGSSAVGSSFFRSPSSTAAASGIFGGIRRTGTVASARAWRSPSPATSEDSLDRWRKTVATPPRSPTPQVTADTVGSLPAMLVAEGEGESPATPGFLLSRPGAVFSTAVPRTPRELLDGHHLFACLRPAEIDGLVARNVVCRATFPPGRRFTSHGCFATPSHVLILIRGCVEVRNGSGVAVGAVNCPGHALLEDEARAFLTGQRRVSPATLIVGTDSEVEAWCVPLQAYRRVIALSRGISRAVTRLSRMESQASLYGSPFPAAVA